MEQLHAKQKKVKKIFEAGNESPLSELQNILQKSDHNKPASIKTSSSVTDENSLKKELAKLSLELKNNNDFTILFDKTMLEIINLRNKFRSEEKYSESDDIRDLLDELNIVIEDNKTGSSWKFKGQ